MPLKFKPNAKLPRGAKKLPKPVHKKLGCWVQLTYDAVVERYGIKWYRVKGGFAEGDNSREDWCADVDQCCLAVHDYHWNGDDFGPSYKSFDDACAGEIKSTQESLERIIKDCECKMKEAEVSMMKIENALKLLL